MEKEKTTASMKKQTKKKPMILAYDIECTGVLGYAYGTWQTNIHKIVEQPILLSFSYAWYEPGKKPKIVCRTLADMDTYGVDPKNDRLLVKELWELFNKADVTMGHNSRSFDDKMSNMFFLKHRLGPVPPRKQLDTKVMASSIGRFPSKSLQNLSEFFGLPGKTEVTHASLWWDIVSGGPKGVKACKSMAEYNNQDVNQTIEIYEILRPYFKNHPVLSRLIDEDEPCPRCLSYDFRVRAYRTTNFNKYQQFCCNSCGGFFSNRKSIGEGDGDIKPKFANV